MVLWSHESAPKRHLDRFSCFCTVRPFGQNPDTDDTTSELAIGRICAINAMRINNNDNNNNNNNNYKSSCVLPLLEQLERTVLINNHIYTEL